MTEGKSAQPSNGSGGNTATLTGFMTVGVALISVGSDLVKNGQYEYGSMLLIIGIALIALGVYLFQRGLIPQVVRKVQATGASVAKRLSAMLKFHVW